jgi:hypothetical protein
MPEKPSETPESDDTYFDESIETLIPPPGPVERVLDGREEISWEEAVRLCRRKIRIWIKRRNGRWNEGYIKGTDENKKTLMIGWKEPGLLGGEADEKAKYVDFATFKEWWKESPALPPRRIEDDGDEDDYESR